MNECVFILAGIPATTTCLSILMALLCIVVVFIGLRIMYRESQKIYRKINNYRNMAERMNDYEHLVGLRADFIAWAKEECWHHHYAAAARALVNYIDGKLAVLSLLPKG